MVNKRRQSVVCQDLLDEGLRLLTAQRAVALWAHLREQHHTVTEGLADADMERWQHRHDTRLHAPTAHVPVLHTHDSPGFASTVANGEQRD